MTTSHARPMSVLLLAVVLVVLVADVAGARTAALPTLSDDQRVYDETGRSLDEQQLGAVRDAVARVAAAGADPVVVVRALDATPQETLDQVERLQVAWTASTGAPAGTSVAVLVNRNPDDDRDARAGIFVGETYDAGNVPRGEQERIVAEELIPPLRDGDVAGALVDALDALAASIRSGPPQDEFELFAERVAAGWAPWALIALAGAGAWLLRRTSRRVERVEQTPAPATTSRPDDLPPALGAALVHGRAHSSGVTATLLDLARRGALVLLPEDDGGRWSTPSVAVRLWSDGPVEDGIARALWTELADRAEDGRVSGDDLGRIVGSPRTVLDAVTAELDVRGWRDGGAGGRVAVAVVTAVAMFAVAAFSLVLVAVSGNPWPLLLGVGATGTVGVLGIVLAASTPRLSASGQRAAVPWTGYRDGLEAAAAQDPPALDLGAALPDLVALEVVDRCREHLEEDASALVDYVSAEEAADAAAVAGFPWWTAVVHTTAPPSVGGGAGVVSGGGATGGGGAAGST